MQDPFFAPYTLEYYRVHSVGERPEGQRIGRTLYQLFRPSSVLDVGCAVGHVLHGIREGASMEGRPIVLRGVDSPHALALIDRAGLRELEASVYVPFDLRRLPERPEISSAKWDLVVCTEVGEHLPPEVGPKLVRFVTESTTRVVWSAAHVGQGDAYGSHVNEQPHEYWQELFDTCGFGFDQGATRELLHLLGDISQSPWYRCLRVYAKR